MLTKINNLQTFLDKLDMSNYYQNLLQHGFLSVNDLKEAKNDLEEKHLIEMGIVKIAHRLKLLRNINNL